jgi:hypothetical protein
MQVSKKAIVGLMSVPQGSDYAALNRTTIITMTAVMTYCGTSGQYHFALFSGLMPRTR